MVCLQAAYGCQLTSCRTVAAVRLDALLRARGQGVRGIMKLLSILMLASLLFGCSNLPVESSDQRNLLSSHTGFYNSETPEFKPSKIGYSAVVNFKEATNKTSDYAQTLNYKVWASSMLERNFKSLPSEEVEKIESTLNTLLATMNQNLITGSDSCTECANLKFINLQIINDFKNWSVSDRVVLIVGLETLSPINTGLRSGLAAASFDTAGNFKSYSITPYNFTTYSTNSMIKDTKVLLKNVLQN